MSEVVSFYFTSVTQKAVVKVNNDTKQNVSKNNSQYETTASMKQQPSSSLERLQSELCETQTTVRSRIMLADVSRLTSARTSKTY